MRSLDSILVTAHDLLGAPARDVHSDGGDRLGDVCAIIPARGGSKGVVGKNLRHVGGQSLIGRAIAAVSQLDRVVVSTDDAQIAAAARAAGAEVIDRPADLSGDTASSESALLHALEVLQSQDRLPDITVFVQATSPFIDPADISRAVKLVREGQADVAFSVTASHAFLWREGPDGPTGVNHDAAQRLRRQDRDPEYRETGAFYVMRTDGLQNHRHRFFGRLAMVEVSAVDALEIDTEDDLRLAEAQVTTMHCSASAESREGRTHG